MGALLAVAESLVVREGALAWSRSPTGAVAMMTRHSRALRSHTSEFYAEYIALFKTIQILLPNFRISKTAEIAKRRSTKLFQKLRKLLGALGFGVVIFQNF